MTFIESVSTVRGASLSEEFRARRRAAASALKEEEGPRTLQAVVMIKLLGCMITAPAPMML